MAKQTEVQNESIDRDVVFIPAEEILTDKNTRFGLKKGRVETMKESIIEKGGIMQPIEVEALEVPVDGKSYRAVYGHYRIAGLIEANKEGHTFQVPATIVDTLTPLERLKRQLSENMERENQSPIDKALAIKELFAQGATRQEVRQVFATPGGRKGLKAQPASNSFVNMTKSFLDLSKKIQTLIHEGEIGVADAYKLTKMTPEKMELAVETAIAARQKELAQAEEEENKFLTEEAKKAESENKLKEAETALETTRKAVESQLAAVKASADAATKSFAAKMSMTDVEAKKVAEEQHKVAEKAASDAQKELEKQKAALKKLEEKADKHKADIVARAAKLTAVKATAKQATAKKANTPLRIQSAAVDVKNAPNTDGIPIVLPAIKKVFSDLTKASQYPKVQEIGKALQDLCNGRIKDNTLLARLAVATGERSEGATAAKKGKKVA